MLSRLRPDPTDATIAVATALLVVCSTAIAQNLPSAPPPERSLLPWGLVLMAAAVGPLFWRRHRPVLTAAVSVFASTVYYPLGFPDGGVGLAGAVALFGVAAAGYRWQAWSLGLAQFLTIHLWETVVYGAPRLGPAVAMLQLVLLVLISGEVVRRRRENRRLARDRADATARTREEEILRRASEERVQLAREVHDAVAHNISLINVQAGTALYLIESEPERATEALAAIKRTSKETLQELRTTLNVLRSVDEQAPRSPAPGLERIEELAEGTRGAGLNVRVQRRGGEHPVSANVGATAYRIVQEALTNVVRHADATAATVEVERAEDAVRVLVRDDGTAAADFLPGNGITGMRERAAALGGEIAAGPCGDGGFAVRAWLPDIGRGAEGLGTGGGEHPTAPSTGSGHGGGQDGADGAGSGNADGIGDDGDGGDADGDSDGTSPNRARKERRG